MESTSSNNPVDNSSGNPNNQPMSVPTVRFAMRPVDKLVENEKKKKIPEDDSREKTRYQKLDVIMKKVEALTSDVKQLKIEKKDQTKIIMRREDIKSALQTMPQFRDMQALITKDDTKRLIGESEQQFKKDMIQHINELIEAVRQEFNVRKLDEFMADASQQIVDLRNAIQELGLIVSHGADSTQILEQYNEVLEKLEATEKRIDAPGCIQKFEEFGDIIIPMFNAIREDIRETVYSSNREKLEEFKTKKMEVQNEDMDCEERVQQNEAIPENEDEDEFSNASGNQIENLRTLMFELFNSMNENLNTEHELMRTEIQKSFMEVSKQLNEKQSKSDLAQWQSEIETKLMKYATKQLATNHRAQMKRIDTLFKQQNEENQQKITSAFRSLEIYIMKVETDQQMFPKWIDMQKHITNSCVALFALLQNPNPNIPVANLLPPLPILPQTSTQQFFPPNPSVILENGDMIEELARGIRPSD